MWVSHLSYHLQSHNDWPLIYGNCAPGEQVINQASISRLTPARLAEQRGTIDISAGRAPQVIRPNL
jgi:hypothetical protein